ncbi:hypothetical protein [Nonomuraea endophytica]|uniref:hypothetical protein n=1 Tax=Nonomuraea endophytica TaxID=714136 RepID=UPI0037C5B6D7
MRRHAVLQLLALLGVAGWVALVTATEGPLTAMAAMTGACAYGWNRAWRAADTEWVEAAAGRSGGRARARLALTQRHHGGPGDSLSCARARAYAHGAWESTRRPDSGPLTAPGRSRAGLTLGDGEGW